MTENIIDRLKTQLGLEPHPSGYGAFIQTWKGDRQVTFVKETKHKGPRASGTSIYFLLAAPNSVQWHKHLSDEGFYWHAGGRVKLHMLTDDGTHTCQILGDVIKYEDCVGQVVVPHDTWYSAELMDGEGFSLYSAVVMPGTLVTIVYWRTIKHKDCVGQVVVPHDTWYSAELRDGEEFSLYSAVVMPGFEFEDWIEGTRQQLLELFPQHKELIERLTDK